MAPSSSGVKTARRVGAIMQKAGNVTLYLRSDEQMHSEAGEAGRSARCPIYVPSTLTALLSGGSCAYALMRSAPSSASKSAPTWGDDHMV